MFPLNAGQHFTKFVGVFHYFRCYEMISNNKIKGKERSQRLIISIETLVRVHQGCQCVIGSRVTGSCGNSWEDPSCCALLTFPLHYFSHLHKNLPKKYVK